MDQVTIHQTLKLALLQLRIRPDPYDKLLADCEAARAAFHGVARNTSLAECTASATLLTDTMFGPIESINFSFLHFIP